MAENNRLKLISLAAWKRGQALLSSGPGEELRPKARRRRILAASFVLCVLVPAFLGAVYYAFIASDRYVAGAGFAVRGMDAGVGSDLIGAVTGLASTGSTTSDSYILLKYLKSRDLFEELEKEFPLREHYSDGDIDFISRLDPSLEIENVVEYWKQRIHTTFDNTSGIITFEVQAYTPEAAERIATLVLEHARKLVNELSSRARQDAVAYAKAEVSRAEERLRTALDSMRNFRESENSLDPAGAARIQLELIGGLEKQLAEIRARIAALRGEVSPDSPSLRNLTRQADALEQQIEERQREISAGKGGADGEALTSQLAAYETLETERSFAQQAYTSALASLEKARVDADRQQRYLAVYSTPAVPQYPLYPKRLLNVFLLLAGLSLVWGIGALLVYSVRDHLS